VLTAQAQPTIEWQKCFGGIREDKAYCVELTTDGGYIIAGYTKSSDGNVTLNKGGFDCWVIKLFSNGNIEWQKTFGGSFDEEARAIKQTTDGGYIVVGYSCSNDGDVTGNHGGADYWILKLDASGNIEWQKSLGGTGTDKAYSVEQTNDGGYIIVGYSYSSNGDLVGNYGFSDAWIIKLSADGNIILNKSFGGTEDDVVFFIKKTTGNGYILGGASFSNNIDLSENHGYFDYWILKLDSVGNIIWNKSFGGSYVEEIQSIDQTTDGGYIVAGFSASNTGEVVGNHGFFDYWILKLDSVGNIEWNKSFGGTEDDIAYSVQQTVDGEYIVVGQSSSVDGDLQFNHGLSDYWIIKLDTVGNIKWQKTYGGTDIEEAYSIKQTIDGGCIVVGCSRSADGDVSGNHGWYDYWIVKLSHLSFIDNKIKLFPNVQVYPNPFVDEIQISNSKNMHMDILLYDAMGRIIQKTMGIGSCLIKTGTIHSGIYFLRTNINNQGSTIIKVIK